MVVENYVTRGSQETYPVFPQLTTYPYLPIPCPQ